MTRIFFFFLFKVNRAVLNFEKNHYFNLTYLKTCKFYIKIIKSFKNLTIYNI